MSDVLPPMPEPDVLMFDGALQSPVSAYTPTRVRDYARAVAAAARREAEAERDALRLHYDAQGHAHADCIEQLQTMTAERDALRADARRWRYARKNLKWATTGIDGLIKLVMFMRMPEPDISVEALKDEDAVAKDYDAAIDAAMAQEKPRVSG